MVAGGVELRYLMLIFERLFNTSTDKADILREHHESTEVKTTMYEDGRAWRGEENFVVSGYTDV